MTEAEAKGLFKAYKCSFQVYTFKDTSYIYAIRTRFRSVWAKLVVPYDALPFTSRQELVSVLETLANESG